MSPRVVAGLTGMLIGIVALLLLVPTALALHDGTMRAALAYGSTTALALVLAFVLRRIGGGSPEEIHRKDALGVVALTWLFLGLVGGLPFVLEGSIPDPMGALFEAVSGFTTTGATVVPDVDGLSRATNLWRCLMHWVGGMGIVVLFVAVFPILGVGAKHLFKSEVPGPITEGLRPKIKQTAVALWWVYGGLTVLCTALLVVAGMPLYDAICHAMSTLGTGGFSTKSASVGAYQSAVIDWIVIAFMLVAGLNFGLYYGLLRGRWTELWRNYELRFYLAVNAAVIALVAVSILDRHPNPIEAVRYAAFQTAAVTTTTGFMTEDFDTYPDIARFALFLCMFMGACAGSTAGGLKASRVFILIKVVLRELRSAVRPNVVQTIRVGGGNLPPDVVRGIGTFFVAYMLLFATTSFVLVFLGLDMISSMSATVACLSSVGPGLADVGPAQNFGFVPGLGKGALCLCMIAGRLEIFALFAVFSPECWRR
ncbi:TrkH family potassium uptake protein [Paraliomyxa miuraensis]|uniref:TrkH family potassium uptake protein n=1 Tax=Paraliomyxa miuraensis TaxID=376150 RepID=UPI002257A5BB|nr:TrkH family potassium uptake protein [Paraliomyxa miuraensis]MCX4246907.1 TrkH family potassium uptake protein [Paraliomyxa miuraensis]